MNDASKRPGAIEFTGFRALCQRVGSWLLCVSMLQAGCAVVGDQQAQAPFESAEDTDAGGATTQTKAKWLDAMVSVYGLAGEDGVLPTQRLEAIWSALARVTGPNAALSFAKQYDSRTYASFSFTWKGAAFPFASGIIPTYLSVAAHVGYAPPFAARFPIDETRFLAALAALQTTSFDESFTPNAVKAIFALALQGTNELTDAHYHQMARVFYSAVAPAFSNELRADIRGSLMHGGSVIGLAAHALAMGYADLRRWAVRHKLAAAHAVFVVTASVTAQILSQSLDLPSELWLTVAQFLCG